MRYEAGFRTPHLLLKLRKIEKYNAYVYDVYEVVQVLENGKVSNSISIEGLSKEQMALLNLRRVENGQIIVKENFFFPNVPHFKEEVVDTFEKLTNLSLLEDITTLAKGKKKEEKTSYGYSRQQFAFAC